MMAPGKIEDSDESESDNEGGGGATLRLTEAMAGA